MHLLRSFTGMQLPFRSDEAQRLLGGDVHGVSDLPIGSRVSTHDSRPDSTASQTKPDPDVSRAASSKDVIRRRRVSSTVTSAAPFGNVAHSDNRFKEYLGGLPPPTHKHPTATFR